MNNETTPNDILDFADEKKIPSALNILTILTFIGCGIVLLITLLTPMLMNFSSKMMDKAAADPDSLTSKQLADIEKAKPLIELTQKNMTLLIIIGLVGVILCFVGALVMRKLKKDGFWIYIVGQVFPVAGNAIILGKYQFADWKSYLWLLIPIVFIILYAGQKKFLIK